MKKTYLIIFISILIIVISFNSVLAASCNGCSYNNRCYNFGDEINASGTRSYCSIDKQILSKKSDNSTCQNNFECSNNYCYYGYCVNRYKEVKGNTEIIKNISNASKNMAIINASISIATLKDSYSINEQINITDPPDEVLNNKVVTGVDENIMDVDNFQDANQVGVNNPVYSYNTPNNIDINGNIAISEGINDLNNNLLDNQLIYNGYIVEFEGVPLVVKDKELKNTARKNKETIKSLGFLGSVYGLFVTKEKDVPKKLKDYKKQVNNRNDNIKARIKNKLGKKNIKSITGNAVANPDDLNVISEWDSVFNGIALDINSSEAEKLKSVPGVKSVSPNLKVNITMMDSVPLIGADKVWQLDSDGNSCLQSGKECLTGKGVTIGIIDTGIDYTHQDLGGNYVERIFSPLSIPYSNKAELFSGLVFYNNTLYYISQNSHLYSYNFKTNEFKDFNFCIFGKPAVYGTKLIYYSGGCDFESPMSWFMYDLNSGINKNIYTFPREGVGALGLSIQSISLDNAITYYSQDYVHKLILYNISNDRISEIPVNSDKSFLFAQISKDIIAYSLNDQLYYYNLSNKIVTGPINIGLNIKSVNSFKDDLIIFTYDYGVNYVGTYNISSRQVYLLNSGEKKTTPYYSNGLIFYSYDWTKNGGMVGAEDIITHKKYYFGNMVSKFYAVDPVESNKLIVLAGNQLYSHDVNKNNDYPPEVQAFPNSKVIGGYDFSGNDFKHNLEDIVPDSDPMDYMGHGTHVAGIAAGSGAGGLKGVAPDAKLYAYKVFPNSYASTIINAINRSADPNQDGDYSDHLDIISLSLGGAGNPDDAMSRAIDNVVSMGIIAVVSAGNNGNSGKYQIGTIGSPGTARKAITVGASYKKDYNGSYWLNKNPKKDQITSFSSAGPVRWAYANGSSTYLIKPDIVAPGAIICSAEWDSAWSDKKCLDDKHVAISGTSMAAPVVAGSAALLKQKHPDWSPEEIKQLLKNTANDLGYVINIQGAGRINLTRALEINERLIVSELYTGGHIYAKLNKINISGEASGGNFKKYILYYSYNDFNVNKNWIKITESNTATDGVLYKDFDLSQFERSSNVNDYLFLKLEVYDSLNNKFSSFNNLITSKDIQITTDMDSQSWPQIYGDKILIRDYGYNTEGYDNIGNPQLFLYDITNKVFKQITNTSDFLLWASIYNNTIVYMSIAEGSRTTLKTYDVLTSNTKTIVNKKISGTIFTQDIFDNKVIYSNWEKINETSHYRVYLYDLVNNQEKIIIDEITHPIYRPSNAKIYDNKIVYVLFKENSSNGFRYDSFNVYLYDISSNQTKQITGYPINAHRADIYYNSVIYSYSNNNGQLINLYNLDTNKTTTIAENISSGFVVYPSIYDNRVVWVDDYNKNIKMYDLITNKTTIISSGEFEKHDPHVFKDKIVWTDKRNGNYDIYLSVLNISLNRPQSKLVNNGNSIFSGNLILILQKSISGVWQNQTAISRSVTIPANGLLKLDIGKDSLDNQVFEGFNNLNFKASSAGDYRVYARFEAGNSFIENSWNFKV